MAVLDKMTIELTGDPSQLQNAMRAAEQAMRQGVSGIEGHLGKLDRAFKSLIATGVGFLSIDFAQQLYQTGRAALSAAGDLAELAEQAGISTDQLQVLVAAGVQAGAQVADITTGMGRFSRSLAEAATEGGKVGETFNKLGVATRTSAGGVRDTFTALVDTAEAISKIESPAQRIQVAMDLLGKGGAKLLPILSGGKERIEEFARQAQKMGLVMGSDLVKAADDAADKLALMDLKSEMLNRTLAAKLMPTWVDFTNKLKEFAAGILAPVDAVGQLEDRIKSLRHNIENWPDWASGRTRAQIADLEAQLEDQMRGRARLNAAGGPAAGDKGKMSPTKPDAVAKMISGLESEVLVGRARLSGGDLAGDIKKQQQAAAQALEGIRGLTKAEEDRIESLVRTIAELKRAQEAQDKYSAALDAEDASLGQLAKTQREVAAAKFNLINSTSEEIEKNETLLGALRQSEEAYRIELRMQQLLAEAKQKNIALGPEEIALLRERATELGRQDQTLTALKDGYEESRRAASDFANVIGTAFEDAILKGSKFSDVLRGVAEDIARIALRTTITKPFENLLTGQGSGSGGGGLLGSLFSGAGNLFSSAGSGSGGGIGSLFSSAGSGIMSLFGGGGGSAAGIALPAAGLLEGGGVAAGSGALMTGGSTGLVSGLGAAMPYVGAALAAGSVLYSIFGKKKPSVGPNGTGGVLMGDGGLFGTMTSGDNGFSGGQVVGFATEAARALSDLATKLGTTVTERGVGGFSELQGRLAFGFNGEGYGNSTSAERAVFDYVNAAIERGALAGITEVDETLIAGAVGGKLEEAMAALEQARVALEGEQLAGLSREFDRLREGIDRTKDSIGQFLDSLKLDDGLSPLKPLEQLNEARRQFYELIARANNGDLDAAARAPQAGRALLGLSQDFYARSSSDYRAEFGGVTTDLNAIQGSLSGRSAEIASLQGRAADAIAAENLTEIRALRESFDRLARAITHDRR